MDRLRAMEVLVAVAEAERSAASATGAPGGHLRVTAPLTFGRAQVAPVLASFLEEQPGATVASYLAARLVAAKVRALVDPAVPRLKRSLTAGR